MIKKIGSHLIKLIFAVTLFIGLEKLCDLKTRGFCLQSILDHDLPAQAAWETGPLEEAEIQKIQTLLDQPYTLIGSGGECFAFASEDGTTVIKFYKLHFNRFMYLRKGLFRVDHSKEAGSLSNHWLTTLSLPPLLNQARNRILGMREYRLNKLFKSTLLAFRELKEETALIYVHLNQTNCFTKPLTLIDTLGIRHTIDPNTVKFAIQQKAEPLVEHLAHLMQEGQIDQAKEGIDSFLQLIVRRCQKGFADQDIYMRNFGFIGKRAIEIDIGPFIKDPEMQKREAIDKELLYATKELKDKLSCYPELFAHLNKQLSSRGQDGEESNSTSCQHLNCDRS